MASPHLNATMPANLASISHTPQPHTGFALWWQDLYATKSRGLIEWYIVVLAQLICFHIPAACIVLLDLAFPSLSQRHKLQSQRRQPKWSQVQHCIQEVVWDYLSGALVHLAIIWYFNYDISLFRVSAELPSTWEVVRDCALGLIAKEILFYYLHRALHIPLIYRHIHKKHHSFTAPIVFAAQYAHPLENVLVNNIPVLLPMWCLDTHVLTLALFLSYQLLETMTTHSGFDFWVFPFAAQGHDLHHEKFNVYFGSMGWLDWLHGTDKMKLEKREQKSMIVE